MLHSARITVARFLVAGCAALLVISALVGDWIGVAVAIVVSISPLLTLRTLRRARVPSDHR